MGSTDWPGYRTAMPGSLFASAISILELETGVLLVERRDAAQGAILRAQAG